MAAAMNETTPLATAPARGLRAAQATRAFVLLAVGLVIAFTATMHSDINFDITTLAIAFVLIGIATGAEYLALRGTPESWWVAARAVIAFGAFGAMFAVRESFTMVIVLAVWALLTAFTTAMRLTRRVQPSRIAVPSLLLSVGLAIVVLAFPQDPIAAIGFFGAYAIIRGVFLGISAFDTARGTTDAVSGAQTSTETSESNS